MLKVLAGQSLTLDALNKACRDWSTLLSKTGSKTTLAIANSIWFNQGFQPDQAFLQRNADFFKAGAAKLDFSDKVSADVINAWVKDATRGTIEKILEQISPSTVMYLINSIYFKSDWQTPFLKEETREMPFQAPDGAVTTKFMHRTDKISYFSGDSATGVALPYDNGQFTYFALLPDGQVTPREWLAKQDSASLFANIAGLMAQKANFTVSLTMPKYEVTYLDTLNDELSGLGMAVAFDPGQADFSQLNAAHAKGLYISEVRHKTFIRVDEKGTEAAAVTSVAIDESMPSFDVELKLDRPFIYGIVDQATGIPLFVGILENPAAK
jgi:serine protease inhibitor